MQWVCLLRNACTLLQIAPVVDASSAQSRADVLAIGLSAVVLLIGLQWISLTPRTPVQASTQLVTYPCTEMCTCKGAAEQYRPSLALVCLQELCVYDLCRLFILQVEPYGGEASFISTALPEAAQAELRWCVLHPCQST